MLDHVKAHTVYVELSSHAVGSSPARVSITLANTLAAALFHPVLSTRCMMYVKSVSILVLPSVLPTVIHMVRSLTD